MWVRVIAANLIMFILPGCSLFSGFVGVSGGDNSRLRSVSGQDPYWQRFYELEKEIAVLRSDMKQVDRLNNPDNVSKSVADGSVDDFLQRLDEQTSKAFDLIDQAITLLDKYELYEITSADKTDERYAIARLSPNIGAVGRIRRDDNGIVTGQSNQRQFRKNQYNFSLVYVYPEQASWEVMWNRLEQANERDKWRGSNPEKLSYFIYVGAYVRESDAINRKSYLLGMLGEEPQMRPRTQTVTVASN